MSHNENRTGLFLLYHFRGTAPTGRDSIAQGGEPWVMEKRKSKKPQRGRDSNVREKHPNSPSFENDRRLYVVAQHEKRDTVYENARQRYV